MSPCDNHLSGIEDMFEEIDERLIDQNVPIPNRPLHALRELSLRLKITLPLTSTKHGDINDKDKNWIITDRLKKWYQCRYGERLKKDFCIGKVAILIRGAPWIIRIPWVWGTVRMVAHPTLPSDLFRSDGIKPTFNILDSIESLSANLRQDLKQSELKDIMRVFKLGFYSISILREHKDQAIVKSALGDIASATSHIIMDKPSYGLSKWASLQAAEKSLKFRIELSGSQYPKSHDLKGLCKILSKLGNPIPERDVIDKVKCSAAIRYGELKTSIEEAVNAQHASLEIILKIFDNELSGK
jgi:HEPN domain-containing protein